MVRFSKYFGRYIHKFDISPIESGGLTKFIIYAVWSINALLFLCKDINLNPEFFFSHNSKESIQCTILKKVSTADIYIEDITFVKTQHVVVILPYDYVLPILDVITLPRDRSPPSKLFS